MLSNRRRSTPGESPKLKSHKSIPAAAIVLAVVVATLVGAPNAATAADPDYCEPVAVLAFRGSGEGNLDSETTSYAGKSNRYGTSDLVTNGWEGSRLRGLFDQFSGLQYDDGFQADQVPVIGIGPKDDTVGAGYPAISAQWEIAGQLNQSAIRGAEAASEIIKAYKGTYSIGCSVTTKFLLTGYSQGAMAARLTAQSVPRDVLGVIDIGDPYQKPDAAGNRGTAANGNGIMRSRYPVVQAALDAYYDLDVSKAATCHKDDPICDYRWGTISRLLAPREHENYYTAAFASETTQDARQLADLAHAQWQRANAAEPAPAGGSVDVVFAIDTTGSMSPYIAQAVATAEKVAADTLADAPGSRVGLVEYRDHGDAFVSRTLVPLTTDFAALTTGLDTLQAGGGGDWPEAVYSGIVEGIGQDWRADVARSIVVIGDAPPHDPEPVTGYTAEQIIGYLAAGAVPAGAAGSRRSALSTPAYSEPGELSAAGLTSELPAATEAAATPIVLYGASANEELSSALQPIADASGGLILPMDDPSALTEALTEALEDSTEAPIAAISVTQPVFAGVPTLVSGIATTAGDANLTYEFDLDGNGEFESDAPGGTVTTAFDSIGAAEASVRVTDSRGRVSIATAQFEVLDSELAQSAFDPTTPTVMVLADGSVSQGSNLAVEVSGGTPEEYLLIPTTGDVWSTPPVFDAYFPPDWRSSGLPIPDSVPANEYRLVVGTTEGGWGLTQVEVITSDAQPTSEPTTPPDPTVTIPSTALPPTAAPAGSPTQSSSLPRTGATADWAFVPIAAALMVLGGTAILIVRRVRRRY